MADEHSITVTVIGAKVLVNPSDAGQNCERLKEPYAQFPGQKPTLTCLHKGQLCTLQGESLKKIAMNRVNAAHPSPMGQVMTFSQAIPGGVESKKGFGSKEARPEYLGRNYFVPSSAILLE